MASVEIACAVVSLVAPGLSSVANVLIPGLGSVLNALAEIGKLCQEMHENQQMLIRVERRYVEIFTQLKAMEERGTLPRQDAVIRYAEQLEQFHQFLIKQQQKNVILRLAAVKGVDQMIRGFHEEIDHLFTLFELAHMDSEASWRQQHANDTAQLVQSLNASLANNSLLAQELRDERAKRESLTILLFELERSRKISQDSKETALLKSAVKKVVDISKRVDAKKVPGWSLIKSAFTKAASLSKLELETIPAWFVSPDDVDFSVEPYSRGSFSQVHRGLLVLRYGPPRSSSSIDVVVKCLENEARANEERFLSQCELWFGMKHAHVVKMLGACHVTSPRFIVCEYADNGTLDSYLDRESTPRASTTRTMLHQTAQALVYLHSREIIHGDLRCSNVLVAGDQAKLSGFGVSFVRGRAPFMSVQPTTGAMRWKAPELLKGCIPSLASDVYSFGMCIIEALTGHAPWRSEDDESVLRSVKKGLLPTQPKELDDRTWRLVQQMCATDPKQRIGIKTVAEHLNSIGQAQTSVESQSASISSQELEQDSTTSRRERCCSDSVSMSSQVTPIDFNMIQCHGSLGTETQDAKQSLSSDSAACEPLKMTKETLVGIIKAIYAEMDPVTTAYKESLQQSPSIPEDERRWYRMQFEEAFMATVSSVYGDFQTLEEDVRLSCFSCVKAKDKDVISALARLETINPDDSTAGRLQDLLLGPAPTSSPSKLPKLSKKELVAILDTINVHLITAMSQLQKSKWSGWVPNKLDNILQDVRSKVYAEFGTNEVDVKIAMEYFMQKGDSTLPIIKERLQQSYGIMKARSNDLTAAGRLRAQLFIKPKG